MKVEKNQQINRKNHKTFHPKRIWRTDICNYSVASLLTNCTSTKSTAIQATYNCILFDNLSIYISRYQQSVRVQSQQPYKLRTYTWCWSIPPKCSRYKIQMKTVFKTEVINYYCILMGLRKCCRMKAGCIRIYAAACVIVINSCGQSLP